MNIKTAWAPDFSPIMAVKTCHLHVVYSDPEDSVGLRDSEYQNSRLICVCPSPRNGLANDLVPISECPNRKKQDDNPPDDKSRWRFDQCDPRLGGTWALFDAVTPPRARLSMTRRSSYNVGTPKVPAHAAKGGEKQWFCGLSRILSSGVCRWLF